MGEWGLDAAYVDRALRVLIADDGQHRVKHLARAVATFQVASPDCNPGAMHRELMTFLREVVEADGVMDEREEMALDAIETAFARETEMSFARAGKSIAALSDRTNGAVKGLAARLAPRAGSPSR